MAKKAQRISSIKVHIGIRVRNLGRSIAFYQKMFGSEPSKISGTLAEFDLLIPPLNFTIYEFGFGERGVLSHLGFQVSSIKEVLAMREKWSQLGLYIGLEKPTKFQSNNEDKIWVDDPDGNRWVVFAAIQENETALQDDL